MGAPSKHALARRRRHMHLRVNLQQVNCMCSLCTAWRGLFCELAERAGGRRVWRLKGLGYNPNPIEGALTRSSCGVQQRPRRASPGLEQVQEQQVQPRQRSHLRLQEGCSDPPHAGQRCAGPQRGEGRVQRAALQPRQEQHAVGCCPCSKERGRVQQPPGLRSAADGQEWVQPRCQQEAAGVCNAHSHAGAARAKAHIRLSFVTALELLKSH